MMSMALATGAAGPVFAKDVGRTENEGHGVARTSLGVRLPSLPGDQAAERTQAGRQADEHHRGRSQWHLELLPAETRFGFDADHQPTKATRVGLALRLPL